MSSVASNSRLFGFPVVWPSFGDPRLHLAAVIISIHILGQTVLGFRVTVPQILSAILASAILEIVITFRRRRALVWPASAMLTGSGVALILRVVGTERHDPWGWESWYLFAAVAALALVTKYVLIFRGAQLFNPSNIGLVVAFLFLGPERVEPLDFWWAPMSVAMVLAYVIILGGGLLITSRLRLLSLAGAFWVTMSAGLGLVAASGHCFTAAWALRPVCGFDFWQIVMTSPELLIFLFFMITDPKTTPAAATARLLFGATLGILSALLMAPQTDEFGTKVALLVSLALLTPVRFVLERRSVLSKPSPRRLFWRGVAVGGAAVVVGATLVAAAAPGPQLSVPIVPAADAVGVTVPLPEVTIDPDVAGLNFDLTPADAQSLAVTLVENLAIESQALRNADPSLLRAINHGQRLIELERAIEAGETRQERLVPSYQFESLHLVVVHQSGGQGGASLGLRATGTVIEVAYSLQGTEVGRTSTPLSYTFVLSQPTGERWMTVAVLPS